MRHISLFTAFLFTSVANAQVYTSVLPGVKTGGTANIHVFAHLPIAGFISVGDLEIEQELSRPYAYVGLARPVTHQAGFVIISLHDLGRSRVIYQWIIENSEVHAGV